MLEVLNSVAYRVECFESVPSGTFVPEEFDVAVLDGFDQYKELRRNSEKVYPLIRLHGSIAFHDYDPKNFVKRAVQAYLLRYVDKMELYGRLAVMEIT